MAIYDIEEQEQLDELKTWWRMHGNKVVSLITVVALAWAGWNGWNWYQRKSAAEASLLFDSVRQAIEAGDSAGAKRASGKLIEGYSRTPYAVYAAMMTAKELAERGDRKTAVLQLTWASTHAIEAELRDLSRLRLAAVQLDDKAYDDALKTLTSKPLPAFAARFDDLRGDVLAAKGNIADAVEAYKQAIKAMPAQKEGAASALLEIVQTKLTLLEGRS